jgi:hypothetical protein
MDKMDHIGDGLEGNFGAVERAAASGRTGSKQLAAALLALTGGLRLICGTVGLVEDLLQLRPKIAHWPSVSRPG